MNDEAAVVGPWIEAKSKHRALCVFAGYPPATDRGSYFAVVDWAMQYPKQPRQASPISAALKTQADRQAAKAEADAKYEIDKAAFKAIEGDRRLMKDSYSAWLNKSASIQASKGQTFTENAADRLIKGGASKDIASVLRSGPYQSFWDALSEEQQSALRRRSSEHPDLLPSSERPNEAPVDSPIKKLDRHPIREIYSDRTHRFARDLGADEAIIDQKLYWLDTHSPKSWRQVTKQGKYQQFKYCKESLVELLDSETWETFVQDERFGGIIMLGGGSGEKDKLICDSLLELLPSQKTVHYSIVDVSIYMLFDAILEIEEELEEAGAHDRIIVRPLIWDFLKLRNAIDQLRHKGSKVAWLILNNTFGNSNRAETQLFECIYEVAEPGDILVIGTETWSGNAADAASEKEQMEANYKGPEVDKFLEYPLRAVAERLGLTHAELHKLIEDKKVNVVPKRWGAVNGYSQIARTITVEISINRPSKLVLLISSRYVEGELAQEAAEYRFRHLITVSHDENKRYKQIVFRFEGRDAVMPHVAPSGQIGNDGEHES